MSSLLATNDFSRNLIMVAQKKTVDLKKRHCFNLAMKFTKNFPKDLYGYGQPLGGWSNIRIKKTKRGEGSFRFT
jgi:hypothetical protein